MAFFIISFAIVGVPETNNFLNKKYFLRSGLRQILYNSSLLETRKYSFIPIYTSQCPGTPTRAFILLAQLVAKALACG